MAFIRFKHTHILALFEYLKYNYIIKILKKLVSLKFYFYFVLF